jgi:ergothioneine biosynthesis protein EgtB
MAQPDGVYRIGHGGGGFCFDHELPRHRIFLEAYEIALRPVTNAEYADFIADGGYARQELWRAEGWELKNAQGWQAPLYWQREGAAWLAFGLHGLRAPAATAPVCHVSYFEADAYARWVGARLPSEAEWECFAAQQSLAGHFLEDGVFEPQPAGAVAATQIYGDVWEWTHSASQPYPGYRAGHVGTGEYSEKFKSNQYVLRGGSCVTPCSHIRASYRHFAAVDERWQFSGIRLARDLD